MDVNATIYCESDNATKKLIQEKASLNVKRAYFYPNTNWAKEEGQSPYFITDLQETKTTWHPIEVIGGGKAGY